MKNEYKMSAAGLEELKKELNYLKTTRSDEVAEMIKVARGFGDLSENSEYDEAKNEQGKLYSRIAELEEVILHAVVIEEGDQPSDQVTIGSTVTVTVVKSYRSCFTVVEVNVSLLAVISKSLSKVLRSCCTCCRSCCDVFRNC